jgi:hypothetical protein
LSAMMRSAGGNPIPRRARRFASFSTRIRGLFLPATVHHVSEPTTIPHVAALSLFSFTPVPVQETCLETLQQIVGVTLLLN